MAPSSPKDPVKRSKRVTKRNYEYAFTSEDELHKLPLKKRLTVSHEKENETSIIQARNHTPKHESMGKSRTNVLNVIHKSGTESESSDSPSSSEDDDDDLFVSLKKLGVKTNYRKFTNSKESKSPSDKLNKSKTTPAKPQLKDKSPNKSEVDKKKLTYDSSHGSSIKRSSIPSTPPSNKSYNTDSVKHSSPNSKCHTPINFPIHLYRKTFNKLANVTPKKRDHESVKTPRSKKEESPMCKSEGKKSVVTRRQSLRCELQKKTPTKGSESHDLKRDVCRSSRKESCKIKEDEKRTGSSVKKSACRSGSVEETPSKRRITYGEELQKTSVSKKQEIIECPTTPLEKARRSLHVAAVPSALQCREKEFENIHTFIETKLMDNIGGCMYISGVPGTGKTATVTQVIRKLKDSCDSNKLSAFQFIEVNGMRLTDPRQAYVRVWQEISGKRDRISSDEAQKKLEAWFSKNDKEKMNTVLLIDELDLMCTRKQDVVYNLLDWPTRYHSRLVVVAIANTMDMPERLLKGRVTSRLGLTRLTFHPYSHKQLEKIISARLSGLNAFSSDAVQLVTRKVAAVSGDARRALDICRRATELPKPDENVHVSHIEQAIKEMTNSNIIKIVRCCSEMEKLFLRSVADETRRTGLDEVEFLKVIEHMLELCILEGQPKLPVPVIINILNRLRCSRLLFTNDIRLGVLQRLTLNVSQDDIYYALK